MFTVEKINFYDVIDMTKVCDNQGPSGHFWNYMTIKLSFKYIEPIGKLSGTLFLIIIF